MICHAILLNDQNFSGYRGHFTSQCYTSHVNMHSRLAPPLLTVASGISLYCGAAIAVGLFEVAHPLFAAWLRVSTAAVVLLVALRPPLSAFRGIAGRSAAFYGVATIGMNMAFYGAIAHLPLGTAVAIEFFGPVVVAALSSRGARDYVALGLATCGVLALSGAQWAGNGVGVAFALLSAMLWGLYIVLGHRITSGSTKETIWGMAVGFGYGAILTLPLAIFLAPHHLAMPVSQFVGLSFALGLLSALIPYGIDLVTLRLAGSGYFALLTALLPLVAACIGYLVLEQSLSQWEIIGICAVVSAVVVRRP